MPECLTGFTCKKDFAPIRESCTDFDFSSTDNGLTEPDYIDQLACKQKRNTKGDLTGQTQTFQKRSVQQKKLSWGPELVCSNYRGSRIDGT